MGNQSGDTKGYSIIWGGIGLIICLATAFVLQEIEMFKDTAYVGIGTLIVGVVYWYFTIIKPLFTK